MSGWVRLWHDMPTDPKWRVIARKSGQRVGDVIAVFSFLMVSASANADERGRTQGVVCEDIGAALDLSEDDVTAIIRAMTGKVMDAEGYLTGWEKRQPKREDSSAERAKRWRDERKRTQANAPERADIDSDAEIDIQALACITHEDSFQEAFEAYPESGRGVSSRPAASTAWNLACFRHPKEELLSAVKAYAGSPDLKKRDFGAPKFERWLEEERWRAWIPPKPKARLTVVKPIAPLVDPERRRLENNWLDLKARADALKLKIGPGPVTDVGARGERIAAATEAAELATAAKAALEAFQPIGA